MSQESNNFVGVYISLWGHCLILKIPDSLQTSFTEEYRDWPLEDNQMFLLFLSLTLGCLSSLGRKQGLNNDLTDNLRSLPDINTVQTHCFFKSLHKQG